MSIQRICPFLLVLSIATSVSAQVDALPQEWKSLSAPAFLQAVRKSAQAGQATPELQQAIAKRSVELLFATEQTLQQLDYTTLAGLYRNGQSQLTADQAGRVRQAISNRADDLSAMKYQDLSGKFALQLLIGATIEERAALVSNWIDAGHLEAEHPKISPQDAVWLYRSLAHPHLREGNFSVVWSGNVIAPQSGDYVFSLSPINVNTKYRNYFIQCNWKVIIDGAQVLNATPDRWTSESNKVSLVANRPVPFRAELNVKASRPVENNLHAMLFWNGPGIQTSIVPAENWTTPDGSQRGLAAQYHVILEIGTGPQTITRIDPAIDFAWTSGRILVPQHDKQREHLVNYFWDQFMSQKYLATCADGKSQHPFLYQPGPMAECLTSSQVRQFLKEVLQRPAMLGPLSARQATALVTAYRFGAEEAVLDTLGKWMQLHSDIGPEITDQFFEKNRFSYRKLTLYLVWQHPDQYRVIQDRFLEMPDGRCCLPAAYTLAYCRLVQGRIEEWNDFLETKLKDKTMTGERRVNWLIARAQAKELLHASSNRHETSSEELLAGTNWLTEAHLLTEDSATQARIYREEIARMAATNHQRSAKQLLTAVTGKVPAKELEVWKGNTEAALKVWRDRRQKDEDKARKDYQTALSERREVAAKQNDDQAVSRYEEILRSTQPESK